MSAYNNPNNIYGLAEEHEGIDFQQRVSSLEKLNSFLANNNRGLDSSMEQTQALLEDLLKDEDSKFIKQLDDLRHCTLAKQLHRVKQSNKSAPRSRFNQLSLLMAIQEAEVPL